MCDPYLIASLALTAGGSVAEAKQANAQQDAYNDLSTAIFEAEDNRQNTFQTAADAAFQESLDVSDPAAMAMAESREKADFASKLNSRVDSRVVSEQLPGAGSVSAPRVVGKEADRQLSKASARNSQNITNLTNLRGLEQAMIDAGLKRSHQGQNLSTIGRNARASSNLVPMELEGARMEAQAAGKGWGDFANILNLASLGTGMYGGFKAGGGEFSWDKLFGGSKSPGTPVSLVPKANPKSMMVFGNPQGPRMASSINIGTGGLY